MSLDQPVAISTPLTAMSDTQERQREVIPRADAPAVRSMARFLVGDLPICLVHADDGRFYAIEDRCSHEDYALSEGELDGYTVECPRHGSRFDIRSGDVLNPPAVLPVVTFAVALSDGAVIVEVAG
jgi:3-phenylpropionate/trans-cinnamate dioxygenase ferredoxin subunit